MLNFVVVSLRFHPELVRKRKVPPVESENLIAWKLGNSAIECKFVASTKRKSHTGFRLVSNSVTLNYLEQRNGRYLRQFTQFCNFGNQLH